ncbi:hypothetical protein AAGG74_16635 [Bacillus mexicanus]|uniref:hypothetical protein n=1 Tax=Bacillus mexicanus TaxID=2834415 RepID=UPI003D1D916F
MAKNDWFDNDTGTYFKVGETVTWYGDPEETKGELKKIEDEKFVVLWEDGQYIDYPNDHQEAIRKY